MQFYFNWHHKHDIWGLGIQWYRNTRFQYPKLVATEYVITFSFIVFSIGAKFTVEHD